MPETKSIVALAIEEAGGIAPLASKLKVSIQLVSMWKKRDRIPAEQCIAVEKATGNKVTRYQLAPQVFGKNPERAKAA
jgi:DNA-binding transcriptional regulator YdaS (Cro superfamily)